MLHVNALGEITRNNEYLAAVSVVYNMDAIAEENGFNWQEVCMLSRTATESEDPKVADLARRWNHCMELHWQRLYHEHLTTEEYAFVKKVQVAQRVTNGRFRVYGVLHDEGVEAISLVQEFIGFVDDTAYWTRLNKVVNDLDGQMKVLNEADHMDHVIYDYGTPEEREEYGENHGRLERQVEVSWEITDLTAVEQEALLTRITVETDALFAESGVCVC